MLLVYSQIQLQFSCLNIRLLNNNHVWEGYEKLHISNKNVFTFFTFVGKVLAGCNLRNQQKTFKFGDNFCNRYILFFCNYNGRSGNKKTHFLGNVTNLL